MNRLSGYIDSSQQVARGSDVEVEVAVSVVDAEAVEGLAVMVHQLGIFNGPAMAIVIHAVANIVGGVINADIFHKIAIPVPAFVPPFIMVNHDDFHATAVMAVMIISISIGLGRGGDKGRNTQGQRR
jgi:hypothetical protein